LIEYKLGSDKRHKEKKENIMDTLAAAPLKMATNSGALVAGTTSTYTTTITIQYCLNGKAFSRTAITNQAASAPTVDAITGQTIAPIAINYGAVVLVMLDSAGAVFHALGPVEALDGAVTASAKFVRAPQFPVGIPQTLVPIAYGIVKVGSNGAAFTVGTTTWNSNSSVAFTNIMGLPDRPQV
jgi:hypothetical protein